MIFSKKALGLAALVMCAALLYMLYFAITSILPFLTDKPKLIDAVIAAPNRKDLQTNFLAALEYDSFVIRMQGVQIALGFTVGLIFSVFGLLLFAIGSIDAFGVDAESGSSKVNLRSTAPGLVVLLLGGLIIAGAVSKDVRRKFDVSYKDGDHRLGVDKAHAPDPQVAPDDENIGSTKKSVRSDAKP